MVEHHFSRLRFTLAGFKRSYQVRILPYTNRIIIYQYSLDQSAQTNQIRFTSVVASVVQKSNYSLNPWFITGFVDGEGSFIILINKNSRLKTGWEVKLKFSITVHQKDKAILEKIKFFLGLGEIYKNRANLIEYNVSSVKDLAIIINNFDKFPLKTKKFADFKLFREVFIIKKNKEHLNISGLIKCVSRKASSNTGLSDKHKLAFPDVVPVARPIVKKQTILDPLWVVGFTSAEGSFIVKVRKSSAYKTGYSVYLVYQLTQHSRDEKLMISLIEYFKCGNIYKDRDAFNFCVTKLSDIVNIIIPFFQKYPIQGVKALDFKDFCQVAKMMKDGIHLANDGLEKIKKIKAGMNQRRK